MVRIWGGKYEEFLDMEETEVKESLPLQRGTDRDRGCGTKSINR